MSTSYRPRRDRLVDSLLLTTRHSVEAMKRFEDIWVKWDSDKILDELEKEVEVIEISSD